MHPDHLPVIEEGPACRSIPTGPKTPRGPRETTKDLGSVAGDSADAILNTGAAQLFSTDLAINSFGPNASLSRSYSSDTTSQTLFGPGWRFNFEANLTTDGVSRTYTDEATRRSFLFAPAGPNRWVSSGAQVGTLTADSESGPYHIALKGGTTLDFDTSGRLVKETDRHGDCVTYQWTSPGMIITASQTATVNYGYDAGDVIRDVSVADFAPGGVPANWIFTFASGKLQRLEYPHPTSIAQRNIAISYSGNSATVSRPARVGLDVSDSMVSETLAWDPVGREISDTVPGEDAASTTDYAASGEARHSVTAAGVVTDSVTDARGNELISSDANGDVTTNVYNATDDLVSRTDPKGSVTTDTYNSFGDQVTEHRTLNSTQAAETSRTFDPQGRLLSEGQLISEGGSRAYTTYQYDPRFTDPVQTVKQGVALSSTSTVNLTSGQVLDDFGQVISATDDAGQLVSATAFDLSGRAIAETDATGTITHHAYDVLGNEVETSRTAGGAWTDWTVKTVDPTGLVLTEQSFVSAGGSPALSATTNHFFDGSGQETSSTASDVGSTRTAYDAKGSVLYSWAATAHNRDETRYATATDTNADGQTVVSQDTSASALQVTTYDNQGQEVAVDPSNAGASTYGYDEMGNLTTTTVPTEGGSTTTQTASYDLGGRQIASSSAIEATTTYTYDLLGRVTATGLAMQPSPRCTTTIYNTLGWVMSSTSADGVTTTHVYDADGRSVKDTVSRPGHGPAETDHTFDVSGHETLTVNPDLSRVETAYDLFGRVTSRIECPRLGAVPTHSVTSAYDERDRATETSDTITSSRTTYSYATSTSGGTQVTRSLPGSTLVISLDAAGVETSRSLAVGTGSGITTVSAVPSCRDDALRPQVWDYKTSTGQSATRCDALDTFGRLSVQLGAGANNSYTYDPSSGRKTSDVINPASLPQVSTAYTYTADGRLAEAKISGGSDLTYAYNTAGEIVQAGSTTFGYSGGVLATSVVGAATTTYSFDSLGRRTSQVSAAASSTFTWSDSDRLLAWAVDRGHDGTVDATATYTYDSAGQRTSSVVASGSVVTTMSYVYEGASLAQLQSTTGTQTTTISYLYDETGKPMALSISTGDPQTVYTLPIRVSDRGDVLCIADYDWTPIVSYTYDSWGNAVATYVGSSGVPLSVAQTIAQLQPLRYAGYTYDSWSGLYYCSARYYDPTTMQFISADPVLSDAEESAYQYCGGDPVGKVDASGLYSRSAAVNYARKYAVHPNSAWVYERHWYDIFSTGTGVDCANFVSQCLLAGGVPTDKDWFYYRQKKEGLLRGSVWWRSASKLRWWASNIAGTSRGTFRISDKSPHYLSAARAGDLMFFILHGKTVHSSIVNQSNATYGTRIAYHSKNKWNVLWTWTGRKSHWDHVAVVRPY